ncbi:hypothetical protein BKA70DRAFT_1278202 [Coprinopsis sp. MPI-PUGE-AT-0042]|nr:hypothetical protein BKA70DRAFT_1278202 [Coprinopsis sp. MPI-PUGE-AT-0042]
MTGTSTDSPTFNDKNADVIFLSSDKPNPVRFYIHSKNLEVSSGAFPPVAIHGARSTGDAIGLLVDADEPVQLPEPATVLELLFAFMYARQHPELEDITFEELAEIAEAVEKYQVYPALTTCKTRMKAFLKDQPVQVGLWAARHGHASILDEAAPWITSMPLLKTLEVLPGHLTFAWVEYYTSWERVKSAFLYYTDPDDADHQNIRSGPVTTPHGLECNAGWMSLSFPIITRFRTDIEAGKNPFLDLNALFLFQSADRECCMNGAIRWRSCVEEAIEDLPKFSQIVRGRSGK